MKGTLYGVGIGAGNPEFLTYQAVQCIQNCTVIAIPDSGNQNFIAYDIVIKAVPELSKKEVVKIYMPMTKDKNILKKYHEEGGKLLLEYLKRGDVAFLTLGDPSIYATYMYLHSFVSKHGGKSCMIPGIPSFCAVASTLNISLAEGNEMVHIIPASYNIEYALSLPGTKILMKAGKSFQKVKNILSQKKNICCYMVENCSMATEKKYFSLEEMPQEAGYFTTIIVKEEKKD